MRSGRFQQKGSEDAFTRHAETLFETRSVVEIREVEARTRTDIEEKKEELRQLVGASYRDLIESADSILAMRQSCELVEANIARMEDGFAALQRSISLAAPVHDTDVTRKRREGLYAVGSRVKYLVDTPEKIWGCLDEQMYLEAAERYMRAGEVHRLLTATEQADQKDILTAFPLLRHQWPLVETFRGQISQRSRDRLQEVGLKVSEYAGALSGVAVIDQLNSGEVLALLLDSRRAWLKSALRKASAQSSLNPHSLALAFSQLVDMIQPSLCHTGELFLEAATGRPPLLFNTLLAETPGSQLFGGIPHPEKELEFWRQHREQLENAMTPLSGKTVTEACQLWLEACAAEIAGEGRLLIEQVQGAKDLAEVESVVRDSSTKGVALSESMEWLTSAFGTKPESPWDCLCELVLKEPVDLWRTLFETIFMDRAKAIIDSSFAALSMREQVDACLADVAATCGQEKGPESSGSGNTAWKLPAQEKDWCSAKATYFSPKVSELRDQLDERLRQILEDVLCILKPPDGSTQRSADLAPYLQQQCSSCMLQMAQELQSRLSGFAESSGAVAVECALFIGRLCAAVGQYSTYLPLILGPPSSWGKERGAAAPNATTNSHQRRTSWLESESGSEGLRVPGRGSGDGGQGSLELLSSVQRSMRRVSLAAHAIWVQWSAAHLAATFRQQLAADQALATPTPLKGWEESVSVAEEEGGQSVELKMALPGLPSAYVLAFLFAACREVHRVGGHSLDRAVLRFLAWVLAEKVLEVYEVFVSSSAAFEQRVSEKGVLQLLFDVRFLTDVLAGGSTINVDGVTPEEAEASTASALAGSKRVRTSHSTPAPANPARRKQVAGLLEALIAEMDPIDWATYEVYLWQNEQRYYNRCSVLFGSLIQLQRLYTDAPQKTPFNADTNTLNLAPPAPRFTYLPISAPQLTPQSGPKSRRSSLTPLEAPMSPMAGAAANGEPSTFASDGLQAMSGLAGAKPLLKSIMGQVGSKFNEGTLKIGGILSDGQVGRLKDRTAGAMATFGDILPAGGLFSSLTTTMKQDG